MATTETDDLAFLRRTFAVAARARQHGNHPFGALLVDGDGTVLIEMENGFLPERDRTGHAERLLATQAGKAYDAPTLARSTLYSSAEPCAMCAGAISFARIRRLYYGAPDPKGGAVDNGVRFFASPSCHHRPEVYAGIGAKEACALLKGFFRARR